MEKRFSHIGELVNNAAVGPDLAATVDTCAEDFQLALEINLIGPYIIARETGRRMKPRAVIVNVRNGMRVGVTRHPRDGDSARLRAHSDDRGVRTRGQN
ncbi:SDR family oxidoreductase [Rhizobium mongolense]|uniref:SDR family oxidoreductase n=1 Tax=Rhizobium mongolense TaxID=57676 RepID=UPI0034A1C70C